MRTLSNVAAAGLQAAFIANSAAEPSTPPSRPVTATITAFSDCRIVTDPDCKGAGVGFQVSRPMRLDQTKVTASGWIDVHGESVSQNLFSGRAETSDFTASAGIDTKLHGKLIRFGGDLTIPLSPNITTKVGIDAAAMDASFKIDGRAYITPHRDVMKIGDRVITTSPAEMTETYKKSGKGPNIGLSGAIAAVYPLTDTLSFAGEMNGRLGHDRNTIRLCATLVGSADSSRLDAAPGSTCTGGNGRAAVFAPPTSGFSYAVGLNAEHHARMRIPEFFAERADKWAASGNREINHAADKINHLIGNSRRHAEAQMDEAMEVSRPSENTSSPEKEVIAKREYVSGSDISRAFRIPTHTETTVYGANFSLAYRFDKASSLTGSCSIPVAVSRGEKPGISCSVSYQHTFR